MKILEDINLEISFVKEEKLVYIGTDTSSGAKYDCETLNDLKSAINEYIDNYVTIEHDEKYQEQEDLEK